MSNNGEYWNVNSAGIFREDYSKNKEVVQPVPAVGNNISDDVVDVQGSTMDGNPMSGNSPQTTSLYSKDTNSVPSEQEIPRKKDGTPVGTQNAGMENAATSPVGQVGAENPGMNPELGNTTTSGVHNVSDPRIGRSLTSQEADDLMQQMEANAEVAPEVELSEETWENEFPNGEVNTPLGRAKFGENQLAKMFLKKRQNEFGMMKPTLENPDVVINEPSRAREGQQSERNSSYLFVKTFIYGGKKVKYYTSVTVMRDGMEVVISNHISERNAIEKRCRRMKSCILMKSILPPALTGT